MHVGYGIDNPRGVDLAATQIRRNQTYFATLLHDWSEAVQIGLEIDYRRTDYTEFTPGVFLDADSLVLGTRFLWRF